MNFLAMPLVAMEGYYSKFNIFHWIHTSTKEEKMFVIGKYLRAPMIKNVTFNCRCFA
jgi:hypothetical protein